jgi:hypothetical protein
MRLAFKSHSSKSMLETPAMQEAGAANQASQPAPLVPQGRTIPRRAASQRPAVPSASWPPSMQQPCAAAPELGHSSLDCNSRPAVGPVSAPSKRNEEYRAVRAPVVIWVVYVTALSGCIAAISLKGIFMQSNTGISSHISSLAYSLSSPADSNASIGSEATFGILASYALGSFTSGAVLTAPARDGSMSLIQMSFPSLLQWSWRHQLLVTLCLCCLTVSHRLVKDDAPSPAKLPPHFVVSLMLLSFTSAILSSFVTLNSALTFRGSNHTNTIIDVFQKLGFALRARDCRYLWQVHLMLWALSGYIAGVCIGSHAFISTFKSSSILVPIIMLSLLSICGLCILLWQALHKFPVPKSTALRRMTAIAMTPLPRAAVSSAPVKAGEFVTLHPRMYIWHLYNAFACGCEPSRFAPAV